MTTRMSRPGAFAKIQSAPGNPRLKGVVRFYQVHGGVLVEADILGLPNSGFFALHIHEGDNCLGMGFPNTGKHYDPTNQPHPMHVGDLPPLLSAGGRAYMRVLTNRFSIPEIIHRTVVIHSGPDDFKTQPAGASGNKIGCGVIQRG